MSKHTRRLTPAYVVMYRCWNKIKLIIPLVIVCVLAFSMLSSATTISTSATIGNSPPIINNVDTKVYATLNEIRLEVSVNVSENNGLGDIDNVTVFLTNQTNLRSNFIATIWLNRTLLGRDKIVDGTTALYNGTLFCPGCPQGNYYIEVKAFDRSGASGSWLNYANPKKAFGILEMVSYVNSTVTTKENIPTTINASIVNTTLEFVTPADASGSLTINRSTLSPSTPLSDPGPGIYLDIDASEGLNIISWALIKVNYADADIEGLGIVEDSLRLYWLNETSWKWTRLEGAGSPPWIFGAGVDTVNNIVWANVSHFSQYGIGGLPNDGGGGNNRGGGGGSGGSGPSGENYTNIIVKENYDLTIYKDKTTSYRFKNEISPVLFVNITCNVNAGLINTAAEVLKGTSTLVKEAPPGIVYKNVNLWVGTSGFSTSKNIKEAIVSFRVENSWFDSNSIAGREIKLVKWDGAKWITLETSEVSRDSTYTYFEGKTTSFSPFAITGIKGAAQATVTTAVLTNQIAPTGTQPVTETAQGAAPSTNLWLIAGVIIVLGATAVIYLKIHFLRLKDF